MAALRNRDQIEGQFGRRLGRLSARHRAELEGLLGDPPNPASVPADFWARVERETEEELAILLLLVLVAAADEHGMDHDAASVAALGIAGDRAATVAASYARTGRDMLATAAQRWLQQAEPPRLPDLRATTLSIFGPDRIAGLAVTETTAMVSAGGELAVRQTVGLAVSDLWITEDDGKVCPICRPLDHATRPVWSAKFPDGPPAHPI